MPSMQNKIISPSTLKSSMYRELFFVSLAIFFQLFSRAGLYFIKSTATPSDSASMLMILSASNSTFLFCWFTLAFIGGVSGAYFFGKYANWDSFFKVMYFVSAVHIFIAVLIVSICVIEEDFANKYGVFFLARFLYSFSGHITIILPIVYLFKKYNESQHILISAYIALATLLGKSLAYGFFYSGPKSMHVWYWLPIAGSFLSLGLYVYVGKYLSSMKQPMVPLKYSAPSMYEKVLGMLIGVACNAGIYYPHFFLTPYLRDIIVIQNYTIRTQYLFYVVFGAFLLPAAKACQKFGTLKMMTISLSWMFFLGVSIPFLPFSNQGFTILLIVFAFFLAGFVTPSFAILYQLFKNAKDLFDIIFWFSLGSIISALCLGVGGRIGFIFNVPLTGMLVFSASTVMCLIGIIIYKNSTRFISFNNTNASVLDQATAQGNRHE